MSKITEIQGLCIRKIEGGKPTENGGKNKCVKYLSHVSINYSMVQYLLGESYRNTVQIEIKFIQSWY